MEDFSALDLLKEEMENTEEIHLKVNVIHRLKTVILSIGPDETMKKLYPYIESKISINNLILKQDYFYNGFINLVILNNILINYNIRFN